MSSTAAMTNTQNLTELKPVKSPIQPKEFIQHTVTVPKLNISKNNAYSLNNVPQNREQEPDVNLKASNNIPDALRYTKNQFEIAFHKVNQSGYQTKKSYETSIVGQDSTYAKLVKQNEKVVKITHISTDIINGYKRTYRSGNQVQISPNATTDMKLLLMEQRLPNLIKNTGMYGDLNGANSHNGWDKNDLYIANYLNSEGVGKRPK